MHWPLVEDDGDEADRLVDENSDEGGVYSLLGK